MLIIPAIDIMGGEVVRLTKGDMDKNVRVYEKDPYIVARKFVDMGVKRLHIVDLDGAKSGFPANKRAIEQIANIDGLVLETGGGIRDSRGVEEWFNIGINYVIIGTAAVKNPGFAMSALDKYPGRVILGIDAREGKVATDGWYETSKISALTLVDKYKYYKAESVIYTDIDKDGTLTGLNLKETASFADNSPFPVIASGGVSSIQDIEQLVNLKNKNISGCIVGKAYYEGKLDLALAIKEFDG